MTHWRRWPATHRALDWLYQRGIVRYFGLCAHRNGGWWLSSVDVPVLGIRYFKRPRQ